MPNPSYQGRVDEFLRCRCDVRAELATRGVIVHEVSRIAPGQKTIAVTALPLPREERSSSKRRAISA